MFWKFVISVLLLPSFLGLEIAAASEKNELQMLPTSKELNAPVVQTKTNQDILNSLPNSVTEYSSVPKDSEVDTEKLKHRKYRRYHRRHRRYYRHRRHYHQRYRNYYRQRLNYPKDIYYRRRHHNRYRNSHQRVHNPLYCHYLRNYDYLHSNYHQRCY
ncbi:hypothetical protein IQ276_012130 [Desmonostoc muscorum LEGE 12446]|uniref:Uncharacterized protein n=1 Tax=Desmonostoc muscorum LEGE 12446 TaxID=1828758 RepID=A0A8J7DB17_DESMC|nr:hypothetical protein [Desmonostoc muscorum]MCF2147179.1 hypothetical protein [Desmonostoc muscorum LEGE 12446]